MGKLQALDPERVFYYFEELTKIPRCSHQEKKVSDYLKNTGEKLGFETIQDEYKNIIIRKPATRGYEDSPGVVLQGHMDIVCEKEEDSKHDFQKDPLDIYIDGDFIRANKTTLGADNGIAVAMGLAILEDNTIEHPMIEFLVTTAEETEMDGALGLSENVLQGSRLLNLDSEEEGELVAGSAGGELIEGRIKGKREEVSGYRRISIEIKGLTGGHSGMEIDKPRGNAIKILNHILQELEKDIDIRLVSISGGSKDNAIPRQSMADLGIKDDDLPIFDDKIEDIKNKVRELYKDREAKLEINIEKKDKVSQVWSKEVFDSVVYLLDKIPTGVYTEIADNDEIVESSSNLAIIGSQVDQISIQVSTRSSVADILVELREKISKEIEGQNGQVIVSGHYPEWEYKKDSELRNLALSVYKEMFNEEMKVTVIHAGLECGVFAEKYPDMDIISFGPNIYDVHTPEEKLSISSTKRIYEYLVKLLKEAK